MCFARMRVSGFRLAPTDTIAVESANDKQQNLHFRFNVGQHAGGYFVCKCALYAHNKSVTQWCVDAMISQNGPPIRTLDYSMLGEYEEKMDSIKYNNSWMTAFRRIRTIMVNLCMSFKIPRTQNKMNRYWTQFGFSPVQWRRIQIKLRRGFNSYLWKISSICHHTCHTFFIGKIFRNFFWVEHFFISGKSFRWSENFPFGKSLRQKCCLRKLKLRNANAPTMAVSDWVDFLKESIENAVQSGSNWNQTEFKISSFSSVWAYTQTYSRNSHVRHAKWCLVICLYAYDFGVQMINNICWSDNEISLSPTCTAANRG